MCYFHQIIFSILKIIHIVAVFSWMAGLFYLPRLFVYHVEATYEETQETFKVMESRLYKIIINPAMIVSVFSGLYLAFSLFSFHNYWFCIKVMCVFCLVIFQCFLNYWRKLLLQDKCQKTSLFFRCINEVPTILLMIIATCLVMKRVL